MPAVSVVMSRVHAGPPNEPGQWGDLAEETCPRGGLKVQRGQPSRLDSGPGRGRNVLRSAKGSFSRSPIGRMGRNVKGSEPSGNRSQTSPWTRSDL